MSMKRQPSIVSFWKPESNKRLSEKVHSDSSSRVDELCEKRPKVSRVFREEWLKQFTWLCYQDGSMKCTICQRAGEQNPFTAASGCTNFQHSTLTRHQSTKDHVESVQILEMQKHFQTTARNADQVYEDKRSAQTDGHMKQLRTVYVMAKKNLAADVFTDLMELQVENGVSNCQNFYKKHEVVEEMEDCLFEILENDQIANIKNSPFYGIMLDETCDINVEKNLAIYIRYVEPDSGVVKVCFCGNEHVTDCTAGGIEEALLEFLHRKTLVADDNSNLFRCIGLGTDGASVMTGVHNGLGARLRRRIPELVQVHCVAHRLNLAASQAAKTVPYLVELHKYIGILYRYFTDSNVKYDKLRELQQLLHGKRKQVKEPTSVRWLSVESAVKMILEYYDAIIMCLEDADARRDPKAVALHTFMATTKFLLTLALLVDVLCVIGILSLGFQKDDVDLGDIRSSINTTKATLRTMRQGSRNVDLVFQDLGGVPAGGKSTVKETVDIKDNQQQRDHFICLRTRYIDNLLDKLDTRFPERDLDVLESLDKIFNPDRYPETQRDLNHYGEPELNTLLEQFGDHVVRDRAENQFLMFKHHVHSFRGACGFKVVCRNVIRDKKDAFPDFVVLAEIATVIPVASAPCERGFSVQNTLKNQFRNRLNPVRLNRLMFIKLQGPPPAEFNFDRAVRLFQRQKQRRQ